MDQSADRRYASGDRIPGTEYVVLRLEAEGGHGALYLVRHHFLEKKLQMLKTLRSFAPSKDLIERLKREAQMLAAMDHPHIVSVTSGGLTDEKTPRPYFVMERLKGRSLAEIVPEAPEGVGVDAALKITIEICDALEYVHTRHGIVHRDIKPDNIFLQVTPRNGSVTKLLDFGVAHMMDLEQRYTKNNLFLGTPRYAAPEQIVGDKPTAQTDLYAVGLVLYELLLGHGPFDDAQTFATVAKAHLETRPPAFPTDRRFPDGLEAVVMSLLEKQAIARPKSAEWLATQLRQIKRAAELVERAQASDLNRTEATPVQNILTGHRGSMTEAGAPLEVPSELLGSDPLRGLPPTTIREIDPAQFAAASAAKGGGAGVSRAPVQVSAGQPRPLSFPESEGPTTTRAGAPLGFQPTMPTPVRAGGLDRLAPTRSLHVEIAGARRNDTEELPDADAFLPPSRLTPAHPTNEGGGGASGQGASVIAAPTEEPLVETRRWLPYVGGAAAGLFVVAVCMVMFLPRSREARWEAPSSEPSSAEPNAAPVVPAPGAATPVPNASPDLPRPAATATPEPATATASAIATPSPPPTPPATAPAITSPRPPLSASPPAAPTPPSPRRRRPASGL